MADSFTKEKRSEIMRAVRSQGNQSTELKIIELFSKHKIKGWRRNYRLYGNPDFVFPKRKIVIFADGCFWHGHNCRNVKPRDNKAYWDKKIKRNKKRDKMVNVALTEKGWQVFRVWECRIAKGKLPKKLLSNVSSPN